MDTALQIFAAIALIAGVCALTFWANRPTETDKAVYELGLNDGAEGREPEAFEHPRNSATYWEGYQEGSRGRNRRADAERLNHRLKDS